jgi:predicted metal-binding protein
MARIGLLTCATMTGEMACSAFGCLEASHAGSGEFARYAERGGAQVVGVISCAGCPTRLAPEKIFRPVRTLVASGVDAIHLSYCLETMCPFAAKYLSVLRAEFPQVEFVSGSHARPAKEDEERAGKLLCAALVERRTSMADFIERRKAPQDKARQ